MSGGEPTNPPKTSITVGTMSMSKTSILFPFPAAEAVILVQSLLLLILAEDDSKSFFNEYPNFSIILSRFKIATLTSL